MVIRLSKLASVFWLALMLPLMSSQAADAYVAEEMIAQVGDPNALMLAIVTSNQAALTQELSKPDAPVNVPSAEGVYPILLAAVYGDDAAMKQLIAADAKLDAADGNGRTALHFLAMRGALNSMKLILSLKPDMARIEDHQGFSPLWTAYASGQLEIADYVIQNEFDSVNRLDDNGEPLAFRFVRAMDKPASVEHMLAHKLNVIRRNRQDQLLHEAARTAGHHDSAMLLEKQYEQILQRYKQQLLQQQKGAGK